LIATQLQILFKQVEQHWTQMKFSAPLHWEHRENEGAVEEDFWKNAFPNWFPRENYYTKFFHSL